MIAIIDYDIGNLGSVLKAFKYLEIDAVLTKDIMEIKKADALVLPGVGAFGEGMQNLRKSGLEKLIIEEVDKGKPFFGICLGMQLLFESSEEASGETGLALIPGEVKKFDPEAVGKIPQIGWNQVDLTKDDPVFAGLNGENYYFVHSYYAAADSDEFVLGKTVYGDTEFTSVVRRNNIWGMQCHPEKSSKVGLQTLKNFGEVVAKWK